MAKKKRKVKAGRKGPQSKSNPRESQRHLGLAFEHFQAGRMQAARESVNRALKQDALSHDALHLSATLYVEEGQLERAAAIFEQSTNTGKASGDLYVDYAAVLAKLGQNQEALGALNHAMELGVRVPELYNRRGGILSGLGRKDEAILAYQEALKIDPLHVDTLNNLGNMKINQGEYEVGLGHLKQALQTLPSHPQIKYNLSRAYQRAGQHERAIPLLKEILAQQGPQPALLNNLSVAYFESGQLSEAITVAEESTRLQPESMEAWMNLARFHEFSGLYEEAEQLYRRVIDDQSEHAEAYYRLAIMLVEIQRPVDANLLCEQGLELLPNDARLWYAMGLACELSGQLKVAIKAYEEAVQRDPNHLPALASLVHVKRRLVEWDYLEALEERVLKLVEQDAGSFSPLLMLNLNSSPQQQYQLIAHYVRQAGLLRYQAAAYQWNHQDHQKKTKIRIGYLSADFHSHATALLICGMLEAHDRERFQVHAYDYGPDDASVMRQRITQAVDVFHDIRQHDLKTIVDLIRAEQIDVLIDLKGYTRDARPGIIAMKPAPITMQYLGYPGTMGLTNVDYVIVDQTVVTREDTDYFTESLIRLPGTYQVNDRSRPMVNASTREAEALPEEAFIYACFNNTHKVTPLMFKLWMRLLKANDKAVLWLLTDQASAQEAFRQQAQVEGVDGARLYFAPRVKLEQHLARHACADLMLDTLPYNAHTTTSDALWMGLPVLTCMGQSFPSRVAASILKSVDLGELITENLVSYERMALELSQDPPRLESMRERLLSQRASGQLFDVRPFAASFERAVEQAYDRFLTGAKSEHLTIEPT